jgi:hypothetical protein
MVWISVDRVLLAVNRVLNRKFASLVNDRREVRAGYQQLVNADGFRLVTKRVGQSRKAAKTSVNPGGEAGSRAPDSPRRARVRVTDAALIEMEGLNVVDGRQLGLAPI